MSLLQRYLEETRNVFINFDFFITNIYLTSDTNFSFIISENVFRMKQRALNEVDMNAFRTLKWFTVSQRFIFFRVHRIKL